MESYTETKAELGINWAAQHSGSTWGHPVPCKDSSYPEHISKWAVSKKGKVLFLASALLAELAFLKFIHEQAWIFTNVLVSWNYLMHCLRQHIPDCELLTTDYSCLLLPVSAICNLPFVLGEWLSKSRGFRAALSLNASSVPPGPDPKPTEFTRKVLLTLSGRGPAQDGCGILSAHEEFIVTTPSEGKNPFLQTSHRCKERGSTNRVGDWSTAKAIFTDALHSFHLCFVHTTWEPDAQAFAALSSADQYSSEKVSDAFVSGAS